MTNTPSTPSTDVASLATMIAHDTAQKLLTTAAASLAAKGMLAPGNEGQFVDLGVAVVLYVGSFAWTFAANWVRRRKMLALKASSAQ